MPRYIDEQYTNSAQSAYDNALAALAQQTAANRTASHPGDYVWVNQVNPDRGGALAHGGTNPVGAPGGWVDPNTLGSKGGLFGSGGGFLGLGEGVQTGLGLAAAIYGGASALGGSGAAEGVGATASPVYGGSVGLSEIAPVGGTAAGTAGGLGTMASTVPTDAQFASMAASPSMSSALGGAAGGGMSGGVMDWLAKNKNLVGAALGALGSQDSKQTTTSDKSPWAPAAPWLTANLGLGQQMQNQYMANPFSQYQKQAYNQSAGIGNQARAMYNNLLPQFNAMQGFDRNNPTAKMAPLNFGGGNLGFTSLPFGG